MLAAREGKLWSLREAIMWVVYVETDTDQNHKKVFVAVLMVKDEERTNKGNVWAKR